MPVPEHLRIVWDGSEPPQEVIHGRDVAANGDPVPGIDFHPHPRVEYEIADWQWRVLCLFMWCVVHLLVNSTLKPEDAARIAEFLKTAREAIET